MIDIHSHILPGVDDGAKNIEKAIEMAKIAEKNGINVIIATPHYIEGENFNISKYNKEILGDLNKKLESEGLRVKILLGNEVFITPDIINLIKEEKVTTLNRSRYLLMELPMLDIPIYTEDIIYELRLKGIVPIIAHPERNKKIIEDPNILYEFIKLGALAQLNLPSILGYYGDEVKKTAEVLLKHDMVHLIGTDAHSTRRGFQKVKLAIDTISKIIGSYKLNKITNENPLAIIKNEELDINEPKRYVPKGKIRMFLEALVGR